MQLIKNNWNYIIGGILGAIAGYLYWRNVGCSSGACPITSSPTISTIYGFFMGSILGGIFKKKSKVENKK